MTVVILKMVLWWLVILVLAILNGTVREKLLIPSLGSFAALLISGLLLAVFIVLVAYIAVPGFASLSAPGYWAIGLCWLIMTVIFEFSFGLMIQHKKVTELMQAYTFKGGNIWPVVLMCVAVAPWIAAHLRGQL